PVACGDVPGGRAGRRRAADREHRLRPGPFVVPRRAARVSGRSGAYRGGELPCEHGRRNAMRPVRFVALSEDGHAFVLADEVGRLLALPIDERVSAALRSDRAGAAAAAPAGVATVANTTASLSPRDIQARI